MQAERQDPGDGDLRLSARGRDGEARARALAAERGAGAAPTSLVGYRSEGRLLIAGPEAPVREAAARLQGTGVAVSLLITEAGGHGDRAPDADAAGAGQQTIRAPLAAVRGHLGAFEVDVVADGGTRPLAPSILTANRPYDLVLDLGRRPSLGAEVPPPGYFAPARDPERLEEALRQIPDMVGEFEKPRYFSYDPDVCAHGASGLKGCTRCLQSCPTDAITSAGERIEVDPYLCQGHGGCATACPTGAITYAFPGPGDRVTRLRRLLETYREAGGEAPVVLFHDGEGGREWMLEHGAALPENVLPQVLEEVGSVGLEVWLAALAFGACAVALLCHGATPAAVRRELEIQADIAAAILRGLGHGGDAVRLLEAEADGTVQALASVRQPRVAAAAAFAGVNEKRTLLRLALDHLHAQSPLRPAVVELPGQAPFGDIQVDAAACTLCMSCASVCPARAVLAGGDRPRLDLVEQNCVQCGLCASACPEDAIRLRPRLLFDREARAARRALNEDAPFRCVACGKPFAATRTIERMLDKLSDHWMYRDKPEQLRRLRMCEDCRIEDMFKDGGGVLDMQDPQ